MASVLIAGKQEGLRRALRVNLEARRYSVMTAGSGEETLALAASRMPDAIILDLGLPDIGGAEIIVELRRWYRRPVIVLSAPASSGDKVAVLDAGADDYVTRPFGMSEFLARLRAALRRDAALPQHPDASAPAIIGRWQVDLSAHQVTLAAPAATPARSARTLRLTPTEWAILTVLLRQPGQLVSTAQLLTGVWGPGFDKHSEYLRFHVAQLRRKLEDTPARPRHLLTERGMGYRYVP
jgi:two-component system KDP operon response regulator KdpE